MQLTQRNTAQTIAITLTTSRLPKQSLLYGVPLAGQLYISENEPQPRLDRPLSRLPSHDPSNHLLAEHKLKHRQRRNRPSQLPLIASLEYSMRSNVGGSFKTLGKIETN